MRSGLSVLIIALVFSFCIACRYQAPGSQRPKRYHSQKKKFGNTKAHGGFKYGHRSSASGKRRAHKLYR